MGMFDSIMLQIKCLYCGETSEIECQTKDLECNLERWEKGDYIGTDQFYYLKCIADCQSKKCIDCQIKKIGYQGGFGRFFDVKVFLQNGFVTGDFEITELHD